MFEDDLFRIDYTFSSFLNDGSIAEEPTDFINEVSLSVYRVDEEKGSDQLIGKGFFSILHLNRALDHDYPLFDVFDGTAEIMNMAEVIFNLEEEDNYWSKLDDFYKFDMLTSYDICFIEQIELLPKYRGKGMGKWVIKNIMERFYGSCGLVILHAYPLQHENGNRYSSEWMSEMKLDELESDLEKAQYKLFHYCQQMGFLNPFESEYFFIRPEEFDYEQFTDEKLPL